jgi:DNA replication protein DnaC
LAWIAGELGFVPLSKTGAELLFEVFSQRYERTSTLVTGNCPSRVERDPRLRAPHWSPARPATHHVHILEMNGDSYRLNSRTGHVWGNRLSEKAV